MVSDVCEQQSLVSNHSRLMCTRNVAGRPISSMENRSDWDMYMEVLIWIIDSEAIAMT